MAFKLFKKESKAAAPEEPMLTSEEIQAMTPDEESSKSVFGDTGGSAEMNLIKAALEKLKGQAEASSELRAVYDEKFSRIQEEIGSLREDIINRERDIQRLEIEAVKASDLVKEVQPETLMGEVRKEDSKIDAVKSKLESFESIFEKIFEELQEMRTKIKMLRGTEEIAKMNKEVLDELSSIKKIEAVVERHADKVETMYTDVQKHFDEYEATRSRVNSVEGDFNDMKKEFNTLKIISSKAASKKDLLDLNESMNNFIEMIQKEVEPIKAAQASFVETSKALLDAKNKHSELVTSMNEALSKIDKAKSGMEDEFLGYKRKYEELAREIAGIKANGSFSNSHSRPSGSYDDPDAIGSAIMPDVEKRIQAARAELMDRIEDLKAHQRDAARMPADTDPKKIKSLLKLAKTKMEEQDIEELREIYVAMKKEYEALTPHNKSKIYPEVEEVYEFIIHDGNMPRP